MLFRKKIERACDYCARSARLEDGQILCCKRGLRTAGDSCRKFKYDPCKRVPSKAKAMDFTRYENEDYSL